MNLLAQKRTWGISGVSMVLAATRCCKQVVAQYAYCFNAKSVARSTLFSGGHRICPDLCYESTWCNEDCPSGPAGVVASCYDGCVYESLAGFEVGRSIAAALDDVYVPGLFVPLTNIVVEEQHTFTAGAVGTFSLIYEAKPKRNDRGYAPDLGTDCTFQFNGNVCGCEQIYCDSDETTYAFVIDCSTFEGGSIINQCTRNDIGGLTTDSSLLEILYFTPFFDCIVPDVIPVPTPPPNKAPLTTAPATTGVPTTKVPTTTVTTTNVPTANVITTKTKAPDIKAPTTGATLPGTVPTTTKAPVTKAPTTGATLPGTVPTTTKGPVTMAPTTGAALPGTVPTTTNAPVTMAPTTGATLPATVPFPTQPNFASSLSSSSSAAVTVLPVRSFVILSLQWTTTTLVAGMILVVTEGGFVY